MPKKAAGTSAKQKKRTRKKAPATTKRAAPAKRAKATPAAKTVARPRKLRVRQVRSGIGHAETYRRTLRALGLKHYQDEIVVDENPSMRGMLHKVRHLVRVLPEEA